MLQSSLILKKKKKVFKSNSTEDSSVIIHLNSELGENIGTVVVRSACWNMQVEGIYKFQWQCSLLC